MRYVFAVVAPLMALFAVVQYNDPDGALWALIYGVPAVWSGIAAARPPLLSGAIARLLLGASVLAGVILVVVLWPQAEAWWRIDVWWDNEESREGMGVMLATAVLLAAFAWSWSEGAHAVETRP